MIYAESETQGEASMLCKSAAKQPKLVAYHPGSGRSQLVNEKPQTVDGRGLVIKDDSRQPKLQDKVASNDNRQVVNEVKMKEEDDGKMRQHVKAKHVANDVKKLLVAGEVWNKQIVDDGKNKKDVGKTHEPPTVKFNLQKVIIFLCCLWVIGHFNCKQVSDMCKHVAHLTKGEGLLTSYVIIPGPGKDASA